MRRDQTRFYESWSDLVTLLLVFFIYLYSISEIDIVKFFEATGSMSDEVKINSQIDFLEKLKRERELLLELMAEIETFIAEENLHDVFSVEYVENKLELNLGNVLLFELGSSELKDKAAFILSKIAVMFNKSTSQIIVEGHTDDIPIHTENFPSNWELSAARAAGVVRFLSSKHIDDNRFLVIGYNQYSPLVPNDSKLNRSKNRRVKITLRPDESSLVGGSKSQIVKQNEVTNELDKDV